jgi:hypothetical protein
MLRLKLTCLGLNLKNLALKNQHCYRPMIAKLAKAEMIVNY